jgi:hypothetical protein
MVMQPERCCCTLQLDSCLFYLSTLPSTGNKAPCSLDKRYVAKIFLTRPN